MSDDAESRDSLIVATAMEGKVRVAFHTDGLIESVALDPFVKRFAVDDLARALRDAIASAQEELRHRFDAASAAAREADQKAARRLSDELDKVNAEYLRQTAVYQDLGVEILKRMGA